MAMLKKWVTYSLSRERLTGSISGGWRQLSKSTPNLQDWHLALKFQPTAPLGPVWVIHTCGKKGRQDFHAWQPKYEILTNSATWARLVGTGTGKTTKSFVLGAGILQNFTEKGKEETSPDHQCHFGPRGWEEVEGNNHLQEATRKS